MVRVLLLLIFILFAPSHAMAVDVPNFPACASPRGELIVSYSDGEHGIVGNNSTHIGSDKVYQLNNDQYMQCFCSVDGKGIQTNWWKDGSLTIDQTKVLESLGWVYVPAGDLWGLTPDPYFALNSDYSCLSTSPQPSSLPSSSSSGSSSQDNGIGGGEDEGEVLGLAATGNTLILLAVFSLSLFTLIAGIRRLRE